MLKYILMKNKVSCNAIKWNQNIPGDIISNTYSNFFYNRKRLSCLHATNTGCKVFKILKLGNKKLNSS